jgi:hypothetical protein
MSAKALDILNATTVDISFQATTDKSYATLQSFRNVTSYSMLSELHACPRKFHLIKANAAMGGGDSSNVDFAMGHSVGAGVAAWLTSRNMTAALFNAFLGWRISFDAAIPTKHKSIYDATTAIEKYAIFHEECLSDWEIWVLPGGKPAIELSISIDFENGYKHYLHIDVILKNKFTGQLAVQENKTTGFRSAEAAIYSNSSQGLSYAIVIDMLSEATSFEVFYCVYSTPSREWELLPFTKHTSVKAGWLLDVQLDHAALTTYKQVNFYPKRGESCYNFMRRCQFYGSCNLAPQVELKELAADAEAERVDFSFTLSQIKDRQRSKMAEEPQQEVSTETSMTSID